MLGLHALPMGATSLIHSGERVMLLSEFTERIRAQFCTRPAEVEFLDDGRLLDKVARISSKDTRVIAPTSRRSSANDRTGPHCDHLIRR